jgi:hypothetical protein
MTAQPVFYIETHMPVSDQNHRKIISMKKFGIATGGA